jgi:lipopolysaccharide biosynthesis glycosyltransferase
VNATSSSRWCVATVTSATYAAGTQVLLTSFLRHNPWFTGTFAVIHDPREPPHGRLRHLPNVRWHRVSDELTRQLTATAYTEAKAARFHSLEIFRLREFDRVLFLDSDIVCTADARALFDMDGALLCSHDQAHFWGHERDRATYESLDAGLARPDTVFGRTFNTGVMRLAPALLDASTFADLLDRIGTRDWSAIRTGHSVSVVLNDHFGGAWTAVSERYNYLITTGMLHYRRQRIPAAEAVFLHFIGRPKPWDANSGETIFNDDHQHALHAWDGEAARCVPPVTRSSGPATSPGTD